MKKTNATTVFAILAFSLLSGCTQWYKGNTHTHTYWSDGNAAPEHVVDWYVNHDYNFLVLSDHNILSHGEKWYPIAQDDWRPLLDEHIEDLKKRFGPGWVVTRDIDGTREMLLKTLPQLRNKFESRSKFIMIQGEEITDSFERAAVHINAININELIPPQHGDSILDTMERNIDAVIQQSKRLNIPMLAHVNHPNMRHAINDQTIARIKGERFFEVYNGHQGVLNNGDDQIPSADEMWDIALTLRLSELYLGLLYGLATDDTHNHHGKGLTSQPGRGWIYVKSNSLTADAIVKAMRNGDFYASTGVKIKKINSNSNSLSLSINPKQGVTYRTDFLGSRLVNGEVVEVGEVLASTNDLKPMYKMKGDELYVRARITSSRLHPNPFAEGDMEMAWVQPVLGLKANKANKSK